MKQLRPLWALFAINCKEALSRRRAFFWESGLMFGNNLLFFMQWVLFFRYFESIRGWQLGELAIIFAVTLGSWGLLSLFFGGVREMGAKILRRELDPLLLHPMGLLPQLLCSRSFPRGAGHLFSAIALPLLFADLHAVGFLCLAIALLCATAIQLAAVVAISSIAFFLPISERLPLLYSDLLLLFGGYPVHILPIAWQVLLFTLIPSGFLAFFPVLLIRDFHLLYLFALVGGALISFFIAHRLFYMGLKRYCR